ncbi:MAG TPA: RpiB/LacA/LacB family sugar-phosphate isomerase [Vicinamibacterales bacterium]|nr:RpiB/LacA/LacB family sugar-phosphate isomerase [Vicinamibacterales bacterium]
MRRFEIITEADARRLEPGTTVELAPGGHITPLARDTLRERRVAVVTAGTGEAPPLAPAAEIRRVAVGTDHTGVALKRALVAWLRSRALTVEDVGTDGPEPVDYPDTAGRVAAAVACGEAEAGIAIDGAGLGSAIAANKVRGVRAAMATDARLARYAREHNGANVLALGALLVDVETAKAIVEAFLSTPMREPRYIRRLAKIRRLEEAPPEAWR